MNFLKLLSKANTFSQNVIASFSRKHDPDLPPAPEQQPSPPLPDNNGGSTRETAPPPQTSEERLASKCELIARDAAYTTKAQKPDPSIIDALVERSEMLALIATAPPFDPSTNIADRRASEELALLDARGVELKEIADIACTEFRKRSDDFKRVQPPGPRPGIPLIIIATGVTGLTLAFSPVIHDLLRGMLPFLRWTIAVAIGAALGLLIVEITVRYCGELRGKALAAGALLALGFLLTRIAVGGWGSVQLGLGSAAIEMSVMVFLELAGAHFANGLAIWEGLNETHRKARDLMEDAGAVLQQILEQGAQVKRRVDELVEENLKGRLWGSDLIRNEKLAVATVRTAYLLAVAKNRTQSVIPLSKEAA